MKFCTGVVRFWEIVHKTFGQNRTIFKHAKHASLSRLFFPILLSFYPYFVEFFSLFYWVFFPYFVEFYQETENPTIQNLYDFEVWKLTFFVKMNFCFHK